MFDRYAVTRLGLQQNGNTASIYRKIPSIGFEGRSLAGETQLIEGRELTNSSLGYLLVYVIHTKESTSAGSHFIFSSGE